MKRLPTSMSDEQNHVVRFELPDGRRIDLDRSLVEKLGPAEAIRAVGLEPFAKGEEEQRLPVYQSGRMIGTLPASFDPEFAASTSPLFSIREGDFRLGRDRWIACPSLGPGDLGSLREFQAGEPERFKPAELLSGEERAFTAGRGAGMETYLKRVLG